MQLFTRFYAVFLIGSILFAAWGFFRWTQVQALTVDVPVRVASVSRLTSPQTKLVKPAASRYRQLEKGTLFFAPLPAPPVVSQPPAPSPQITFVSKLVLHGVTKGATADADRAIVGLLGDATQQTWLVAPGAVVGGETVVKIEEKAIVVKNGTGKGVVGLKAE